MKKILLIVFALVFLTGCNNKITTCNIKSDKFEQNWKYKTKNDIVTAVDLDISYDNSLFNITNLSALTTNEKKVLEKTILSNLGFEKNSYDGLEIKIIIIDKINVEIKIDLEKVDKKLLEKIGINLYDGIDINTVIKNMEKSNAKCY